MAASTVRERVALTVRVKVCVLGDAYALISHQYLRHLGSWTIDFDRMTYYFPQ